MFTTVFITVVTVAVELVIGFAFDLQFWPTEWSLDNYRTVFDTSLFTSALRNSIGISLIATTISVTLATFAVARLEFKGKKAVLSTALAIAMFPTVALVGPLFDMWRSLGIYDT